MLDDAEEVTNDEAQLLALIPEDGSTVTNPRVQGELGWDDDRYWSVRNALADRDIVRPGRGRGGTVKRVIKQPADKPITVVPDAEVEPSTTVAELRRREDDLYDPIFSVLKGDAAKDARRNPVGIEVTARQGSRQTGGTWSRPDLVSVEVKTFEYVPGKFLEVITYEVKPSDVINVQAVYEALAHRRAATHSYVVLHVPTEQASALEDAISAVRQVARAHGIGVLTMGDPGDYGTWDELEEAVRVEPDPERLNQFIDQQLSQTLKNRIARALR